MADYYKQNPNLSLQELIAQGKEALPEFKEIVHNIFSDLKEAHPNLFNSATVETNEKAENRIIEKVKGDYKGDCSEITDIIRARIIVGPLEEVQIVRDYAQKMSDEYDVTSLKDRFATPTESGFRDVNMTIRLSNGHVAEFRFEQEDMVEYGKMTHYIYEKSQEIRRAAIEDAEINGYPAPQFTPEQEKQLEVNDVVSNYLHQVGADIVDQDACLDEASKKRILEAHLEGAALEVATPDANKKIHELVEEAKEAVRLEKEKHALEKQQETENRLETLAQEAVEARALADQKTTELEQAQALADEKAQIVEQTATAAAERIDRLEYSTQLLKDEMGKVPPNVAAVNERVCEEHQAEINELNAEVARAAAEAEAAREIVETVLPEQQQAEAAALAAEAALKEEEARRQEEKQEALEEQRIQEEVRQAEATQKAEEVVQQKEKEAELAEQEAHQKAQEAKGAEEVAEQKEAEALEAQQIATQKAEEAKEAEEIALKKEDEAQKAEEAVKQANKEEQEAKEIQETEEQAKQKAIEAEEARAEADQKTEEAREAEEVAKQKAEEALEARENAAQKTEEAQQAEALAEEKAAEAKQARAEISEDTAAQNVQAEEKEAAQEITASQEEQVSQVPQLTEEPPLVVTEGAETVQALNSNVQENAVTSEIASSIAQTEQDETALHGEETAGLVASGENVESSQIPNESTDMLQVDGTAQLQAAEASQATDVVEQADAALDLSNAVEQAASETTLETGQSNNVADQVLSGDVRTEVPTGANLEAEHEGAAQAEDGTAISQIAQDNPAELATQGDPPVSTDKKEVLETVESQADQEEAPSELQNAGKSLEQEEEHAVQQAAQQTVEDSSRSTAEIETSAVSSEAKQEERKEDFAIAATQVTSMGMGAGSGSSGGPMCFLMPCLPVSSSGWPYKRNSNFWCDLM